MGWESFGVVGFHLGLLLQGQTKIAKPKSAFDFLLLVLEVSNVKPTYRKSWAGNLLMWSDLTLNPSFKVLEVWISYRKSWARNLLMLSDLILNPPSLQGQMRIAKIKSAYNSLILVPRGLQCHTNL